ncbi:MAG: phytanoyl-CoA dioxygenase family protein [Halioglobus sp.]|nr:phytanoyl-CoA dioxygenase family protein [Halioglobus sp.]
MIAANRAATCRQLEELGEQGYTLIPGFLSSRQLERVNALYDAMLGSHRGRNDFEGNRTERIYTLVARHRAFQDIVEDPRILALCDALFQPNYLLTASQAIVISPGETPQPWHTDDSFYPLPRPRPMISLSTIVAVEDFTAKNGGTNGHTVNYYPDRNLRLTLAAANGRIPGCLCAPNRFQPSSEHHDHAAAATGLHVQESRHRARGHCAPVGKRRGLRKL